MKILLIKPYSPSTSATGKWRKNTGGGCRVPAYFVVAYSRVSSRSFRFTGHELYSFALLVLQASRRKLDRIGPRHQPPGGQLFCIKRPIPSRVRLPDSPSVNFPTKLSLHIKTLSCWLPLPTVQ